MRKKIYALLTAFSILLTSGCSGQTPAVVKPPHFMQVSSLSDTSSVPASEQAPYSAPERPPVPVSSTAAEEPADKPPADEPPGVSMSLENGQLQIHRRPLKSTPMGKAGTWTIFVYMCGSDLESKGGLASLDIEEMMSASTGNDLQFVIQTGGSKKWSNKNISAKSLQRYIIKNGKMIMLDELALTSMGDGSTLEGFMKWGIENYPAAKMGFIFWNHGGGSIAGVCNDELFGNDSLELSEIDKALQSADSVMTDAFEFIGFDTCLMSTIETANVIAGYARYMYASQEVEPAPGWDYKAIADKIRGEPSCTGRELGKVVCDTYYKMCEEIGSGSFGTLAAIDLAKIDNLLIKFNAYAEQIYNATEDSDVLSRYSRKVKKAENFGGNNRFEGYTNMVDIGALVEAGSEIAVGTEEVFAALREAVIYSRSGSSHANACGLSIYYPLGSKADSRELTVFGDIAVSPYYLALVTRSAYASSNNGSTHGYDSDDFFNFWNWFWGDWSDDGFDDFFDGFFGDFWGDIDETAPTGVSALVSFAKEAAWNKDGSCGFTLASVSLGFVESVESEVLLKRGDKLIEVGSGAPVQCDWDKGVFRTEFDGRGFALPDKQILAAYIVAENDAQTVYSARIMLNNEPTNLRFTYYKDTDKIVLDGTWNGLDANGMAAREITALKKGDRISPVYHASQAGARDYDFQGADYIYDGKIGLHRSPFANGEYLCRFRVCDVFGDYRETSTPAITVMNGDVMIGNAA